MTDTTTIALHQDDKRRIDEYIRSTFGTDPAETPYRLAINHMIDNTGED